VAKAVPKASVKAPTKAASAKAAPKLAAKAPARVKKPTAIAPEVPAPKAPRVRIARPVAQPAAAPAKAPAKSPAKAPAKAPALRAPRVSAKKASPPTPVDLAASTRADAESAKLWPFPTGARP
jgi:hypothetical protein